ncbi:MAG: PTS sugar transporter subunit IIC [Elusimicrobia bacterium]|nr:PTS sugar transporter subunit IIC [Elusimicrobiota bacterium]
MSLEKIIYSAVFSGILYLDNVHVGQFLFSRPALAGIILGYINGCPVEGAQAGIITELLLFDFVPVGGSVPPCGIAAVAISLLLYAHTGINLSLAFFTGIFLSVLYAKVEFFLRAYRSKWNAKIEEKIIAGEHKLYPRLILALITESAALSAFIATAFCFFHILFGFIKMSFIYPAADLAYSVMPWLGLSALYFRFRTQVRKK